jgi:predicted 3-demethylubiquinone-9 3-methyltransferase (glyoxalase superfamily)
MSRLHRILNNDKTIFTALFSIIKSNNMQKIMPFLWFDNQAEEAVNFYTSVFKNSKIGAISRYGEAGPGIPGSVMVASFELEGQKFTALNGGPQFKFTEAISFVVDCKSQEEVDYFWNKLSAGGSESMCGWLKDKFGLKKPMPGNNKTLKNLKWQKQTRHKKRLICLKQTI